MADNFWIFWNVCGLIGVAAYLLGVSESKERFRLRTYVTVCLIMFMLGPLGIPFLILLGWIADRLEL